MKVYFKADIYVATELYVNNDPNQGCDPVTFMDCGIVETVKKESLDDLIKWIAQDYSNIEHFEDNRYETSYENIERDGTYVSNMVSIYIYRCVYDEYPISADLSIDFNRGL